ncbi:L-threonine 3-dehydrogenase [Corynebacterium diphtheriae]|nr:L-threonine 3-dehydrogenase [Corynebacterium diphtheriae]
MRAAVISGKGLLATADLPTPAVGPNEVLIRVAYVGICGSDLHYYQDGAVGAFEVREPLVPGHEMSGTWYCGDGASGDVWAVLCGFGGASAFVAWWCVFGECVDVAAYAGCYAGVFVGA